MMIESQRPAASDNALCCVMNNKVSNGSDAISVNILAYV